MNYILNLKTYKQRAKLTQQEVADKLDIPRTQLVRYEKGINELPIRYLIEMCKIYNITPNDILGFELPQEGA